MSISSAPNVLSPNIWRDTLCISTQYLGCGTLDFLFYSGWFWRHRWTEAITIESSHVCFGICQMHGRTQLARGPHTIQREVYTADARTACPASVLILHALFVDSRLKTSGSRDGMLRRRTEMKTAARLRPWPFGRRACPRSNQSCP
jgi:hypothetical protein